MKRCNKFVIHNRAVERFFAMSEQEMKIPSYANSATIYSFNIWHNNKNQRNLKYKRYCRVYILEESEELYDIVIKDLINGAIQKFSLKTFSEMKRIVAEHGIDYSCTEIATTAHKTAEATISNRNVEETLYSSQEVPEITQLLFCMNYDYGRKDRRYRSVSIDKDMSSIEKIYDKTTLKGIEKLAFTMFEFCKEIKGDRFHRQVNDFLSWQ